MVYQSRNEALHSPKIQLVGNKTDFSMPKILHRLPYYALQIEDQLAKVQVSGC
jgi:hypothetical protein